MKSRALMLLLCLVGVLSPFAARAIDLNLAGTLQLDYLFSPFGRSDPRPASHTLDGFTEELSLKLAIDISSHASANVKALLRLPRLRGRHGCCRLPPRR
nr:hypothetical protein [Deltaproteobacteria bacterium]